MWTQIRLLLYEQSDLGPHCLPVCKNRFEKFARIFRRRQKQTTFSDADFLGVLRVNGNKLSGALNFTLIKWLVWVNKANQDISHCEVIDI